MLTTPESLERHIVSDSACCELRRRIESATLSTEDIEAFVERLLQDFHPGRTFYGDKLLALVAVAVATGPEPFSSCFLRELAELQCAELPLAPRVARHMLQQGGRLPLL